MKHSIRLIICLSVFSLQISACATSKVWKTTKDIENINIYSASSTLISSSKNISRYNPPKFLINYKISNGRYGQNTLFPPYDEGYILIERMDSASRLYEGLTSLLKEPTEYQITSIDAKIVNLTSLDGEKSNSVRMDVNVRLPIDLDHRILKESNGSYNVGLITNETTSEGIGYFLLGGPSGGGPSGKAKISFIEDASGLSIDSSWNPLIINPTAYRIGITFSENIENRRYLKSTAERILFTPFSILFDVATSPFQLIAILSVPLWVQW